MIYDCFTSEILNQCRLDNKFKIERGLNGSASWRTRIKTVSDTKNQRKSALPASAKISVPILN
jgi:hypothetical protein